MLPENNDVASVAPETIKSISILRYIWRKRRIKQDQDKEAPSSDENASYDEESKEPRKAKNRKKVRKKKLPTVRLQLLWWWLVITKPEEIHHKKDIVINLSDTNDLTDTSSFGTGEYPTEENSSAWQSVDDVLEAPIVWIYRSGKDWWDKTTRFLQSCVRYVFVFSYALYSEPSSDLETILPIFSDLRMDFCSFR